MLQGPVPRSIAGPGACEMNFGAMWYGWSGRGSLERGGRGNPPPPQHCSPHSTPKAFSYPNTSPNRIVNRQ